MHADLTLHGESDPTPVHAVVLLGHRSVVGRSREHATVHIRGHRVSRAHAAFELREDGLYVTDLGSTNGTYLDGEPLVAHVPTLAHNGSWVGVGEYRIRCTVPQQGRGRPAHASQLLPANEFEIKGEIGRGAMGQVWAAYQKDPGRLVAIKMLDPARTDVSPEDYKRFLREAKLSQVASENIVELFELRTAGLAPFLVMEYVSGPSADALLEDKVLPIADALSIAEDIARGLAALARHGVVHRDVKPSNILLTPAGRAKLGDFGVAKQPGSADTPLTQTGFAMGTLAYLAPELLEDPKLVDARADLYGLGATLYDLLAGQPPLSLSSSIADAMQQVLEEDPAWLLVHRTDCPPEVAAFVQRLLAKSPEDRPQPADAVVRELRRLRAALPPEAPRTPAPPPSVWVGEDTVIELALADLCRERVDAIATWADVALTGKQSPLDAAIHEAAGPELQQRCRALGGCAVGDAVATPAGALPAKRVIHVASPIFGQERRRGDALLESAYRRAVRIAAQEGCESLSLPPLSCGVFGYPLEQAARIALHGLRAALPTSRGVRRVRICFSRERELVAFAKVFAAAAVAKV